MIGIICKMSGKHIEQVQASRTSSSASSTSDRGGTSTSAGRVSDPSPSVASLPSMMSTLNPYAKEFKLDPNDKIFTPFQRSRPSFPIADNSLHHPPMANATHMHGIPSSVRAGPSFAAQQSVMYNPLAAPMQQQIYNPSVPQAVNSQQPNFTHFVSLPLAIYPGLLDKLANFKETILREMAADGGNYRNCTSLLRMLQSFHPLSNEEQVKAATEVMQSASSIVKDTLENRPLLIILKGLKCIKGSEAKAIVVYAPVEVIGGDEPLLRAYDAIKDAFVHAGLVVGYDRKNLKDKNAGNRFRPIR
ncbi:uncharacterized protein LOC121769083 isoform X2 [Salvia splendens]|uniref:uncharacterized protein LOC121769083 isoform X2 n=1 Tax=Salvia splendens TaxID=180675 RepID=UPI001C25ECAE|nr:uncharacterized protein LOC121769083 isoform X2 [Salvia splendens]